MVHNSRIFLDGGDPSETREILALLGALDGQTTNPTLIAKNPDAQKRLAEGKKFSAQEILDFYKKVVRKLSGLIPNGSISVEVYADKQTSAQEMLAQAREMFSWIPNAHIKFPTTAAGLAAAEQAVKKGLRVNMTLVFSQEQAAAVHAATRGAKKGDVFVSPFIGRLDDIGLNGMDLIKNIRRMYDEVGSHVEVLAASIRSLEHFFASLAYKADILTAPAKAIKEWVAFSSHLLRSSEGTGGVVENFQYDAKGLKPIPYQNVDLSGDWRTFAISHPLTDKGVDRFAADWNNLIQQVEESSSFKYQF